MAKRRTMTLAGTEYQIGQAKKLCNGILHSWPLWEILSGPELTIIMDMWSYYVRESDYDQKIELVRVGETTHSSGNTHRAFHTKLWARKGWQYPSYLLCFRPGDRTLKEKVTKALRRAVQDQVDACWRSQGNGRKGHVHHDPPFVALRDQWVFEAGGYEKIPIADSDKGQGWKMTDVEQIKDWSLFHASEADLQFLTVEQHKAIHAGGKKDLVSDKTGNG